jgi:phenylpyruvate tautomerase PptA (4-oxalocrotonate tautomerase family)
MPMIDLYHPEGSFTPQAQAKLVNDLTALLLEAATKAREMLKARVARMGQ